ncbi:MoaD/ThiS family protein [Dyadobacter arcticus]|uniref:Molybdopterin converting factor small subunit n=1 Tax=Dyadobacter arcticus TaxID=1078754 RepID=A0ABX0URW5_9BACT|nr:MoaD/ThiS family protein [Dyadobacter arcticus]NIJ55714.1 molybdopterin converting factor small subunit [Dyadobacter arcticus]
MSVHITYFGMLAEMAGQADEVWTMDEQLTVGKFRGLLLEKYPSMREKKFKIAVNQKISEDFVPIELAAEIAVLPPFAGG